MMRSGGIFMRVWLRSLRAMHYALRAQRGGSSKIMHSEISACYSVVECPKAHLEHLGDTTLCEDIDTLPDI